MEYKEGRDRARDFINLYTYYFIIGVVSLIALFFLPFLGSTVDLGVALPNTTAGWIVWVSTKLIVAVINVLIFHSFMQQAKVNVRDDAKFKEGKEILGKVKRKNYIPKSPEKWVSMQYSRKGIMIALCTALTTVALTQAILTFDWISMLTYLFTIVMGLIFGILQMKNAELYWTEEFWNYAKMIEMEQINGKSKSNIDNSGSADSNTDSLDNGDTETRQMKLPDEDNEEFEEALNKRFIEAIKEIEMEDVNGNN